MNILNAILSQAIFGQTEVTASDLDFRGIYDASGGVAPAPLTKGHYYVVSNGGTISGTVYNANDFIWSNGTLWQRTPALLTGVTLVNGQTGNVSINTDNLPVGDNKFLIQEQVDKVNNLPENTIEELDKKFKKEWNSDWLTEGNTHLFTTTADKNKLANLPANVNDELEKKFNKKSSTDNLIEGATNLFITPVEKSKLSNVPVNTISELNKKIDNTITADNIPDGTTKFLLNETQKDKLDSIPDDIATELNNKFDIDDDNTDDIIESTTRKFMSTIEKTKLENVPENTNAELLTKYDIFNDDMDKIKDGTDYVKTKNNFTDDLKLKLYNLTDNYKGYFLTSTDLETEFPTAIAGTYATVEATNSIWIWNDEYNQWVDSTSAGTGDMLRVTYDPSNKAKDVFNMDNMEEGLLNAVISKADKNKLQDIDININTQTVTNEEKLAIATIEDKLELTDLTDFLTDNTADTDTVGLQFKNGKLKANLLYQNSNTTLLTEDTEGLQVDVKDNSSTQKINVSLDGTLITNKQELNFINNDNVTFTIEEDNINDRVNIELTTSSTGSDGKVKISDTDTVNAYLQGKIVGATDKIDINRINVSDNEQLVISAGDDIFDMKFNNTDDITEGLTNLFFTQDERIKLDALVNGLDFSLIFNKDDDTIDDIQDGLNYVKMTVDEQLKLANLNDLLTYKGTVSKEEDLILSELNTGDMFIISDDFDIYLKNEIIFYDGVEIIKLKQVVEPNFVDTEFTLNNGVNTTQFNLSNLTKNVVLSVPDKSGKIAVLDDIKTELPITTMVVVNETKEMDKFPVSITGCKYFYTIKAGANTRIGELMVVHNGTDVRFTDTVVDFDTLVDVDFDMEIVNGEVIVSVIGLDKEWTIKFTKIEL